MKIMIQKILITDITTLEKKNAFLPSWVVVTTLLSAIALQAIKELAIST